ncbi:MAG: class I SAM-dependent methyltransferase [Clostridia bacterium]|nr:class I SAM-dependent methyltransferase [Clostridia bacterium]
MQLQVNEHYDRLALSGNDPVNDPPMLQEYMDGWDGVPFLDAMGEIDGKDVLEIGCGSGRQALRVLDRGCGAYTGIDISDETLLLASENLAAYENVTLDCCHFPLEIPEGTFDIVFSTLTFMHIQDKLRACSAAAGLLKPGGRFVLSISKDTSDMLDMGDYTVKLYPDSPDEIRACLRASRLRLHEVIETEKAYIFVAFNS